MNTSSAPETLLLNVSTTTSPYHDGEELNSDDAAWALTCAFLILTMQTGFAMLEGGCVSSKNMANIMVKNVCDVSIGGIAYWMFGYGLTYGQPSTPFVGFGDFFFNEGDKSIMGSRFSHYFFQFSFASTATTIVSGAVAERMKLHAYMIFSFLNIVIYAIPACWCWAKQGFLKNLDFYDFAGVCVVHLNGGTSAIVASFMLGPRLNRFENPSLYEMSSPVTALTGMFMLTWAWLGFNCGSTFGVTGNKWKISAVVAVCTLNGAIGGGLMGLLLSMLHHRGQVRVDYVINSILGGLVSVTGVCSITTTYEALLVGAIGGAIAVYTERVTVKIKLDDPVGAIPVHFGAALWGTLAVGIFGKDNVVGSLRGRNGCLHGGGFMMLGVNALGALSVIVWSAILTCLFLVICDKTLGIRMNREEEYLGADYVEHNVRSVRLSDRLNDILRTLDEERISKLMTRLFEEMSRESRQEKEAKPNSLPSSRPISALHNGRAPHMTISSGFPNIPNEAPHLFHRKTMNKREIESGRQGRKSFTSPNVVVPIEGPPRIENGLDHMGRNVTPTV